MKSPLLLLLFVAAASPLHAQKEYQLPPPIGTLPKTNIILFSASIDATDELLVHKGKVQIRHVAGNLPTVMTINGKEWEPKWTRNVTDAFAKFSPPLPALANSQISVELLQGRGSATIAEEPDVKNNDTLVVQIRDGGNGASTAEVKITIVPR